MDTNNNNKGSSSNSSPRPDRPRLTEQEKKNNHIASENKRRKAIRDGFDRLAELVDLPGQGRSENVVLEQTIKVIKEQIAEYHAHLEEAKRLGVDMSDLIIPGIPDPKPSSQAQAVQEPEREPEIHAQFHGQMSEYHAIMAEAVRLGLDVPRLQINDIPNPEAAGQTQELWKSDVNAQELQYQALQEERIAPQGEVFPSGQAFTGIPTISLQSGLPQPEPPRPEPYTVNPTEPYPEQTFNDIITMLAPSEIPQETSLAHQEIPQGQYFIPPQADPQGQTPTLPQLTHQGHMQVPLSPTLIQERVFLPEQALAQGQMIPPLHTFPQEQSFPLGQETPQGQEMPRGGTLSQSQGVDLEEIQEILQG